MIVLHIDAHWPHWLLFAHIAQHTPGLIVVAAACADACLGKLRDTWAALGPLVGATLRMRAERARDAQPVEPRATAAARWKAGDAQGAASWCKRYEDILRSLRPPREGQLV